MLGISRWIGKGGSYRTVQRFFHTVLPWATLFWLFFRQHLLRPGAQYLIVGDECIVTKAGKKTHGLDRFFASLYGRVVPSLAFFALSLVDVAERRSYPVMVEHVVRSEAEKATAKAARQKKKAKSKSKKRRETGPSPRQQESEQEPGHLNSRTDPDTKDGEEVARTDS